MDKINTYRQRVLRAGELLKEADCILIGAGSGLSTAAGLEYDGEDFKREFKPWIDKYGITDLYSSSFYPFKTEEEKWAYWARHIWFSRFRTGASPLYKQLLGLVDGRDFFVITTNTDGEFLKAGLDPEKLFYTQGDYAYIQDAEGEDKTLYYDEDLVNKMLENTVDCRIPSDLVPRDPINGHLMSVNLRCDDTFVEDDNWDVMCGRYRDFVLRASSQKLVLMEFGIGFNTPGIIRLPFEKMALEYKNAALVRFNKDYPGTSLGKPSEFIAFTETLDENLLHEIKKASL